MSEFNKYVGQWAVCNHGRVGRIDKVEPLDDGERLLFSGINMVTGEPWQSVAPRILHEEVRDSWMALVRDVVSELEGES